MVPAPEAARVALRVRREDRTRKAVHVARDAVTSFTVVRKALLGALGTDMDIWFPLPLANARPGDDAWRRVLADELAWRRAPKRAIEKPQDWADCLKAWDDGAKDRYASLARNLSNAYAVAIEDGAKRPEALLCAWEFAHESANARAATDPFLGRVVRAAEDEACRGAAVRAAWMLAETDADAGTRLLKHGLADRLVMAAEACTDDGAPQPARFAGRDALVAARDAAPEEKRSAYEPVINALVAASGFALERGAPVEDLGGWVDATLGRLLPVVDRSAQLSAGYALYKLGLTPHGRTLDPDVLTPVGATLERLSRDATYDPCHPDEAHCEWRDRAHTYAFCRALASVGKALRNKLREEKLAERRGPELDRNLPSSRRERGRQRGAFLMKAVRAKRQCGDVFDVVATVCVTVARLARGWATSAAAHGLVREESPLLGRTTLYTLCRCIPLLLARKHGGSLAAPCPASALARGADRVFRNRRGNRVDGNPVELLLDKGSLEVAVQVRRETLEIVWKLATGRGGVLSTAGLSPALVKPLRSALRSDHAHEDSRSEDARAVAGLLAAAATTILLRFCSDSVPHAEELERLGSDVIAECLAALEPGRNDDVAKAALFSMQKMSARDHRLRLLFAARCAERLGELANRSRGADIQVEALHVLMNLSVALEACGAVARHALLPALEVAAASEPEVRAFAVSLLANLSRDARVCNRLHLHKLRVDYGHEAFARLTARRVADARRDGARGATAWEASYGAFRVGPAAGDAARDGVDPWAPEVAGGCAAKGWGKRCVLAPGGARNTFLFPAKGRSKFGDCETRLVAFKAVVGSRVGDGAPIYLIPGARSPRGARRRTRAGRRGPPAARGRRAASAR
ncbi:hypothetical protein JL722_2935 [Aureococcus anophagefferens]|nr:hypothetical protein JL722_2935 [Aureococcus anophagefferens]